ncbi:ADP-ribosyl cyclase/cyclic ADP-ribose hydrolase 1 [Nelusetta ayraudi]|uniref:ADP-ribosyl cyclase/cyclic ADP-ribose hydrolase 1 n=1 Tax=Nelusetta ayraudi TaxID=303726 RepID=UPI003F6F1F2D
MEQHGSGGRRRRRRPLIIIGVVVVALLIIVVIAVAVSLKQRRGKDNFQSTFMARCNKFMGYNCNQVWKAFQQAYVGRDPRKVPMDAYNPFIIETPFHNPICNKLIFWSKTKEIAHDFTEKNKNCFITVEDTLMGSVVDGLIWCGKEGSNETFTTGCPEWGEGENPVRSFWKRASAAFADAACGDVTVMLNGSLDTPYHPESVFASIEVPRFTSTKVKSLNVVLVTQNNLDTCTNDSLKNLQKELAHGITYNCKEVAEIQIQKCSSSSGMQCGTCW